MQVVKASSLIRSVPGTVDEARTPILPLASHSSSMDLTSSHRKSYLGSLLAVLTDGLLPLLSLFFSAYNTAELFLVDTSYGWLGLGLFCLPSVLVLLFYVENMLHRSVDFRRANRTFLSVARRG